MALTGVHVECGVSVDRGNSTIFSRLWSETIAYGGTTTKSAPDNFDVQRLTFRVRNASAGEAWVSTGSAPDTSAAISSTDSNVRAHFTAGELRDLPAKPGWKVSAAAVS
ncbi:hypothetical protein LAV84_04985 [Rhizobium sp. VS19-DR104.2]|uniref:hypothetical protein n=1 Tax=unclassified Rhizobium TaxID=2613769 RepID=UPI001CC6A940|nr:MULTISPECIES: hypothetical protein [unclassified Rhizobium]MBZ5757962.1 hypothetical protein [Rhizobium sp. VS19-DR96]MBZ5765208.1 hypothetical protein [Rhizobium sp. VS19-DR129.2]MBZ5772751.1 hypothetical protein [Rhizobium sp. VS19-DRK62.2]MBZ5782562.1 hypothetical protein [Rhizobium sp. VS19-DR121]MBZ5800010.1 hypothetical protein [Rhizobium sp. VS19-DR181]